jgi:hypothetical protein
MTSDKPEATAGRVRVKVSIKTHLSVGKYYYILETKALLFISYRIGKQGRCSIKIIYQHPHINQFVNKEGLFYDCQTRAGSHLELNLLTGQKP